MSDDLRTLAQAVVDAWQEPARMAKVYRSLEALAVALGGVENIGAETARAILAALDAAEAQGYARAMGEVVAYADSAAMGCAPLWDPRVAGRQDGFDHVSDWARERLPAAAERD